MTTDARKRPLVAAALGIVYPGLGHVYLRSWHRALLWFAAVVITIIVFVPESLLYGVATPGDLLTVAANIPIEAAVALPLVAIFNAVDAYLTAKRENAHVDGVRCPHCGKVVDEDLSFCHWCTSELAVETDESTQP